MKSGQKIKTRISAIIDADVKFAAERLAENENRSLSNYLECLLKKEIERNKINEIN